MKCFTTSLLYLSFLLLGVGRFRSPAAALPNPYKPPVESWGHLPEGRIWGAVAGTSLDSHGHLWVLERCGGVSCADSTLAPILELDSASGNVLKSFGAGLLVVPHAIYIDQRDSDSIWVVDEGEKDGKGEQVWKFTPGGNRLLVLGKAGLKGETPQTFNHPTSVVTAKNGDIFVTDGHSGASQTVARILKFSRDGKFLKTWGKEGTAPGDLNDPHSIAMDTEGRLVVADRGNFRIDIFDQDGKFITSWKQFGIPSGVAVDGKDTLYVADNFLRPQAPGFPRGIRIGSAKTGKVKAFLADPDQDPNDGSIGPESLSVDDRGTIYDGEVNRRMIKKYVLRR
ncbi:MAG TPA: peptidyl-alpha-hydroxyglycine alpha-amidating lyase family protein [Acidobacteriaceae bacterium]|jgi:sugar lactone lactonase YvrE|nr:peptidyl-alpha-hydroxyglycine alpha-amidating lyase family protein [Acidobacteriaceae bacterium]